MIRERLSAHYLYHNRQLIKHGIVVLDENRCVLDVINNGGKVVELPYMRFLNGILLPLKNDSKENLVALERNILSALEKNENATLIQILKQEASNYIANLEKGKSFSYALMKNVDYKERRVKLPLSLSMVRWLY